MSGLEQAMLGELKRLAGWFDLHNHPSMTREILNVIVRVDPEWVRKWDRCDQEGHPDGD